MAKRGSSAAQGAAQVPKSNVDMDWVMQTSRNALVKFEKLERDLGDAQKNVIRESTRVRFFSLLARVYSPAFV